MEDQSKKKKLNKIFLNCQMIVKMNQFNKNQFYKIRIKMNKSEKVLQLDGNLSKLIDSLCFQLAVNVVDSNSLSLIEIIEWRNREEISDQELLELYIGWLQSKNIYDVFTVRQMEVYSKEELIEYEGPIKNILKVDEITKILQILNGLYNEIYIKRRMKGSSKEIITNEVKRIEEVQKLFSYLDNFGVINLRLSQLFFLSASILISQNNQIPNHFQHFKSLFKIILTEMNSIHGSVSLRAFKNFFLIQKDKPLFIKNLHIILLQIQNLTHFTSELKTKSSNSLSHQSNSLPNLFQQSFLKWKSLSKFKHQQQKLILFKRIFQQNQQTFLFHSSTQSKTIYQILIQKYGKQLLNCLQIDQGLLLQFNNVLFDTIDKYLSTFQKVSVILNKNRLKGFQSQTNKNQNQGSHQRSKYINQKQLMINAKQSFQNSIKKKSQLNIQDSNKKISKKVIKQRTPQKRAKNYNEFTASNNYRSKTPTHRKSMSHNNLFREFGSTQKKASGHTAGRQTTPTKSTLSFLTEGPRSYRAAQKRGLNQGNFYDKLFFFRNKRVESYQIVMKRLKNK